MREIKVVAIPSFIQGISTLAKTKREGFNF